MKNSNLVDIEGFGKQELILYAIEGTNEIYIGTFKYNKQDYFGILDKNGRILVPFSTNRIIDSFKTNDNLDYCFTIANNNSCESYHISKQNNYYSLVTIVKSNPNESCYLMESEIDNYWLAKRQSTFGYDYAIYDVKRESFISPFVTTIKFEKDRSALIFAYLEKKVATILDDEEYDFTTLACYINQDGSFISPLLDMEEEAYYETKKLNFDPEYQLFYSFVAHILEQHQQKFYEKQERISEILSEMRQNCLPTKVLKSYKYNTKIIPFTRSDNHDTK